MRKLAAVLACGVLAFGCSVALAADPGKGAAAPTPALGAQQKIPVPIIAIVDVQRILRESLAAKSVQQQLENFRIKSQTDIAHEEEMLRKSEKELTDSRVNLQPDAYAEREQLLRQRFLGVERHVQSKRKVLDQAFTDSMNTVRNSLLEIVQKSAQNHGANLVVVKQQALWSEPSLDITDEVLRALDKSLPRVAVTVPAEEKASKP